MNKDLRKGVWDSGDMRFVMETLPIINKEYKMCHYAKLADGNYLIVMPRIFNRDPFELKFSIITERAFRRFVKNKKLQV